MTDTTDQNSENNGKVLYCSFCGKSQHEVRKLIAGPSVFICDECVDLAMTLFKKRSKSPTMWSHRTGYRSPKPLKQPR